MTCYSLQTYKPFLRLLFVPNLYFCCKTKQLERDYGVLKSIRRPSKLRNLVVYSCLSDPLYVNDKRFHGFLFSFQSSLDDLRVFSNVDWIRDPTNRGSTIVYYFLLADYFIKYCKVVIYNYVLC